MVRASFSLTDPRQVVLAITPFEIPDVSLVTRLGQAAFPVVDLGHDLQAAKKVLDHLSSQDVEFGVRFSNDVFVDELQLPEKARMVVLPRPRSTHPFVDKWVLTQVVSVDEAQQVCESNHCQGLIAKGWESGGRVGEVASFVLLQQLVEQVDLPIWVQGGVGKHTAAAAICAGAMGVVLDCQLACVNESSLSDAVKTAVAKFDGSESVVVNGYRVCVPPGTSVADLRELSEREFFERLGHKPTRDLIPAGQDIAFAGFLAESHKTARALVGAIIDGIDAHVKQAQALVARTPIVVGQGTWFDLSGGARSHESRE